MPRLTLALNLAKTTPRTLVCCSVHIEPLGDEGLADGRRIDPPPEADLIHRRRREASGPPPLSRRQAARQGRDQPVAVERRGTGNKHLWAGHRDPGPGHGRDSGQDGCGRRHPADELTAAGRDDAAGQLRVAANPALLWLDDGSRAFPVSESAGQLQSESSVQAELLPLVASGLYAIDASQLSARTRNQITGLFIDNLRHDAAQAAPRAAAHAAPR